MKFMIEMSNVEHSNLKVFAAKQGLTMREVVLRGINIYISSIKSPPLQALSQVDIHNNLVNMFRASGLSEVDAADKMDIEAGLFGDYLHKRKDVPLSILDDAGIFLDPDNWVDSDVAL